MPPYISADTARHADRALPAGQRRAPRADAGDPDDAVLAAVLIRMWALASGRSLRRDVPPAQLSEEELINFWADDMSPPTGRHARPGEPDRAPSTQQPGKAVLQAPQSRRRTRRRSRKKTTSGRRKRPADPATA